MSNEIAQVLDKLIPRGGGKPDIIYVSLEEYLSRLSNLNRKLQGSKYRMEQWQVICEKHITEFKKQAALFQSSDFSGLKKTDTFKFSLRDTKVENEFEALLYSFSTTLSALARVVASFLQNSTDFHSHSKLSNQLKRHVGFEETCQIVSEASELWATELTDRRDAATHYIALSIVSILNSSIDELGIGNEVVQIGITKKPIKYVSIWEDELPTIGGSNHTSFIYDTKHEVHELRDNQNNIIVKRESPLQKKPELIDGEKFVQNLYNMFTIYITNVLASLASKMQSNCS